MAGDVPAEWSDQVVHGSLALGSQVLNWGADLAPDRYEAPKRFSPRRFKSRARLRPNASFTIWLINCDGAGQRAEA